MGVSYNRRVSALLVRLVGIALWLASPFAFRDGRIGLTLLLVAVGFVVMLAAGAMANGARGRSPTEGRTPAAPIELDDARLATVLRLLDDGRKIEAIKLVREASGAGLREAKGYVDTLEGA
jgi:hypothetical protein